MNGHRKHVQKLLAKLKKAKIPVDIDKCKFDVMETRYLSLMISTDGIKIDPAKVNAIRQWDTLIYVQKVRFFVGFCNFYCQFIKNFSKIVKPLNTLTKKDIKFE